MKKLIYIIGITLLYSCGQNSEIPSKEEEPKIQDRIPRIYKTLYGCVQEKSMNFNIIIEPLDTELVLETGLLYSESPNPSFEDHVYSISEPSFHNKRVLKGLKAGTKYYIKAYAKGNSGTNYSEEFSIQTYEKALNLKLGDQYQGGYVLYLDCTEHHGVILASTDQPGAQSQSMAKDLAEQSSREGYDNWRLPSRVELDQIYKEFHLKGKGEFTTGGLYERYWSSKVQVDRSRQPAVTTGLAVDFEEGKTYSMNPAYRLNYRLVRDF